MRTIYFSEVPKQAYGAAIIETILRKDEVTELHNHDFCELFFVNRGEVIHFLNDEPFLMRRGDFWLIRQEDVHCYRRNSDEVASFVNISFPAQFYENLFQSVYLGDQENRGLSDRGTLNAAQMIVVEELLALLLKVDLSTDENLHLKKALLLSLLQTILFSQTVSDAQTPDRIPVWLSQAITKLQEPEILQQGIKGLVQVGGRSQEHITRQLRKYYNITPSQMINKLRIDQAQKLLATTDLSVLDISMTVGYESVSYFNRLFMQQTGMSPRMYRNSLQNFV